MRPEASRPRFRWLRTGAVATLAALLGTAPLRAADLPLQPFQVSHLEVEPGLSHNWVLSLAKDPRGFLWVGTQNGLNRFDGAALKVYRHAPSDPRSLPSSVVGALYVDRRGRLWAGSSWGHEGVALYDRARDDFTRFPTGAQESCLRGADVRVMLEAPGGRLWVGTDAGVCLLDPETGT